VRYSALEFSVGSRWRCRPVVGKLLEKITDAWEPIVLHAAIFRLPLAIQQRLMYNVSGSLDTFEQKWNREKNNHTSNGSIGGFDHLFLWYRLSLFVSFLAIGKLRFCLPLSIIKVNDGIAIATIRKCRNDRSKNHKKGGRKI
jgi:hypothetical protein